MFVGPSGLLKWHCFETMAGSSPQLRATEIEFRRGIWLCLAGVRKPTNFFRVKQHVRRSVGFLKNEFMRMHGRLASCYFVQQTRLDRFDVAVPRRFIDNGPKQSCFSRHVRRFVLPSQNSEIKRSCLPVSWDPKRESGISMGLWILSPPHGRSLSPWHGVRRLWREVINTINIVTFSAARQPCDTSIGLACDQPKRGTLGHC
jgi:hypothetical protein